MLVRPFNGLQVYRRIKLAHPHVTAIIMTGYAQEFKDLIDQALNESTFAFFTKPLHMSELLRVLNTIAREHESQSGTNLRPEVL